MWLHRDADQVVPTIQSRAKYYLHEAYHAWGGVLLIAEGSPSGTWVREGAHIMAIQGAQSSSDDATSDIWYV